MHKLTRVHFPVKSLDVALILQPVHVANSSAFVVEFIRALGFDALVLGSITGGKLGFDTFALP